LYSLSRLYSSDLHLSKHQNCTLSQDCTLQICTLQSTRIVLSQGCTFQDCTPQHQPQSKQAIHPVIYLDSFLCHSTEDNIES
jgi:hypothetical protein